MTTSLWPPWPDLQLGTSSQLLQLDSWPGCELTEAAAKFAALRRACDSRGLATNHELAAAICSQAVTHGQDLRSVSRSHEFPAAADGCLIT